MIPSRGVTTTKGTHPTSLGDDLIASPAARAVVAATVLLAITVTLWIPFGIQGNPQGDGWILMNRVASGEYWFFAENPTRLFAFVPWTLAYFLSPDGFTGIHILLIALLWGKAWMFYEILRRLPGCNDGFAFLTAALSIVYPASTQWLSLDAIEGLHKEQYFFCSKVARI